METVSAKEYFLYLFEMRMSGTYHSFCYYCKNKSITDIKSLSDKELVNLLQEFELSINQNEIYNGMLLSDAFKKLLTIRIVKTWFYISKYTYGYQYLFNSPFIKKNNSFVKNKKNKWGTSLSNNGSMFYVSSFACYNVKVFNTAKQLSSFMTKKEKLLAKRRVERYLKSQKLFLDNRVKIISLRINNIETSIKEKQ